MKRCRWTFLLVLVSCVLAFGQESKKFFDAPIVVTDPLFRMDDLGDMDGDGDPDAIGWWYYPSFPNDIRISVIQNHSTDGTFYFDNQRMDVHVPQLSGQNSMPWDSLLADFNGDGREEYVLVIRGELKVISLWFTPGILLDVFSRSQSVAHSGVTAGDFDGDGDLDFAVSDTTGLRFYLNINNQAFVDGPVLAAPGILRIVTGDTTGDGIDDVVALGSSNLRSFTLIGGVAALASTMSHGIVQEPGRPIKPSVGDVDGDSNLDVVVFSRFGNYAVFKGDGNGNFTTSGSLIGGPADRLIDIDLDGDLDGVCCGGTSFPVVYNTKKSDFLISLNDGNGVFSKSFSIPALGADRLAGAMDVDGDGDIDLVAGRSVYYADGPIVAPIVGHGRQGGVGLVGPVDLDGDSDMDLVDKINSMMVNSADGTFQSLPFFVVAPPSNQFTKLRGVGDFDGDGFVDFICDNLDTTTQLFLHMRLLRGDGNGHFSDLGPCSLPGIQFDDAAANPASPRWSFAADVDTDGDIDFVAGSADFVDNSRMWLNDGTGVFASGPALGKINQCYDLDDDGLNDLLLSDGSICWGIVGGNWSGPQLQSPFPLAKCQLDDVNNDGLMDILGHTGTQVLQLVNQGGRVFSVEQTPYIGIVFPQPENVFAGYLDLDGDGIKDLIRHGNLLDYPGTMRVLRSITNPSSASNPQATEWSRQVMNGDALVDVDGDGDLDLVGSRIYKNLRRRPIDSGIIRQFGAGTSGSGGFVPRLNGKGPLASGDTASLVVSGLLGGGSTFLVYGDLRLEQVGYPLPSLTNYTNATTIFSLYAQGAYNVPGVGDLNLSYIVPPNLSGLSFFFQVYVYDIGAPDQYSCSAGLEIRYQ